MYQKVVNLGMAREKKEKTVSQRVTERLHKKVKGIVKKSGHSVIWFYDKAVEEKIARETYEISQR